jgi:hypothetical protein
MLSWSFVPISLQQWTILCLVIKSPHGNVGHYLKQKMHWKRKTAPYNSDQNDIGRKIEPKRKRQGGFQPTLSCQTNCTWNRQYTLKDRLTTTLLISYHMVRRKPQIGYLTPLDAPSTPMSRKETNLRGIGTRRRDKLGEFGRISHCRFGSLDKCYQPWERRWEIRSWINYWTLCRYRRPQYMYHRPRRSWQISHEVPPTYNSTNGFRI